MRTWSRVLLPAAAAAASLIPTSGLALNLVAAGGFEGVVAFSGSGVPPLPALCSPVSFTVSASAAGTAKEGGSYFAGTVSVSGSGSSPCEDVSHGAGNLSISAYGTSLCSCDPVNEARQIVEEILYPPPPPPTAASGCAISSCVQVARTMTCGPLTGPYFRFGSEVIGDLLGSCSVDNQSTVTTGVVVVATLAPQTVGEGIIAPVHSAAIAGAYVGQA